MNINPMDHNDITVQNLSNQQSKNSSKKPIPSRQHIHITNKKKWNPMPPTPLEYSCWSTHPTAVAVGAAALFVCLVILAGVLTVYLTSSRSKMVNCELKFNRIPQNPVEYMSSLRSVAVGDFNNDTWIDMVVANSAVNSIGIHFGYSNITFARPVVYPTGSYSNPCMVTVEDLNNDHRLDIAVANFGTNNVGIFFGLPNGSFTSQIELSTASSRPISISVTDLNSDTLFDIATVNYGTHSISIFYSYGDGRFSMPMTYSTGYDSYPSSLASGDFNNDNYKDIAIADYGTDTVSILFGTSNGTFANLINFWTGLNSHPISITAGHFNEDNLLDIAVANYGANEIGVLLNNGDDTFANQYTYSINSSSPYSIKVADFNQDHHLDLVVTCKGMKNIGVFLGYGNGTFATPATYSTGSFSSISFAIVDLNKDQRPDMIVISNDTNTIDILLGYYEGFPKQTIYSTDSYPNYIAVADFNNDNRLDIVVTNSNNGTIGILFGYGNGSFANQIAYATDSGPYGVVIGDFNNDNRLDIVVTNQVGGSVSVFLGYGNGSFEKQITDSIDPTPVSIASGDFNNDNRLDIVVSFQSKNGINVLLGNGNGSFRNPIMYSTPGPCPFFIAVGDFNYDSQADIVITNQNNNSISVFLPKRT